MEQILNFRIWQGVRQTQSQKRKRKLKTVSKTKNVNY